ncbi:MAG: rod-binding protein [Candidatus Sulfotelmatobacter sp.]|jgi:Rod binding domain-containing protein
MSDFRIAAQPIDISTLTQAKSDLAAKSLRNPSTKGSSSKIDKAAHDFESILVGQWLEKAEKSFATVPGADPDQDQDSGHDQFQSIACQYLAQGLTKNGGFGIAAMISKHLTAVEAKRTGNGAKPAGGISSQSVAPKLKNSQ